MLGRLLLVAAIVVGGICFQRWNVRRWRERQHEKQVEIPRWEDEGGTSQPPAGSVGANAEDGIAHG